MVDIKYWVALNRLHQLGTVRFRRLERHFGDLEHAWRAAPGDLEAAGLEGKVARQVAAAREEISPDAEMARLERAGVSAITWHDEAYPPLLREIYDPPPVLYLKSSLREADQRSVAVVGTRNPTAYGREAATRLAGDLARSGISIISGLAMGIDGVAHRAALEGGGRTIAVVASGLDIVYPREHAALSRQIEEQGAVVSEFPLGTRPDRRWFPRRNRLISGMSLGTLVVEADEGSGARWTVEHALEQDREVFCVPGSIFSPASRFTNRMIKEGAKLVSNHLDVLEELNLSAVNIRPRQLEIPLPESPAFDRAEEGEEGALLRHLDQEPVHIDDITRRASLPITAVSSLLTMLELKGRVKQVGCMHYIRVREGTPVYGN